MATKRLPTSRVLEHPPLFGLESECQVTFFSHSGDTLPREACTAQMMQHASRGMVSLFGQDEFDLFLANGGRFYRDAMCGLCNLEYATAECTTPDELVAHIRAGDAIIAAALDNYVASQDHVETAILSKCNFDYRGHTNGSHENHLHTLSPRYLGPQLIPLLASRCIVSGGGGFDDTSPGIDFMTSPRVNYLEHVMSRGAQNARAIYTIKDESLASRGYHRLQLLSSESVRYEASERLRFSPVALVLRVVTAGERPGDAMCLADPLEAINVFARDPGGSATAKLENGGQVTALDIQRHYLGQIRSCLSAPWMPDWAEAECVRWERVLDALADNPQCLIGHLDWPTKRHLYRAHCERRGIPWETLSRWRQALRELDADTRPADCDGFFSVAPRTPRLEHLLESRGSKRARVATALDRHDLKLADLPRFVALRDELFELDIHFGDIGRDSLFASLERNGMIAAGGVNSEAITHAMCKPPCGTRAGLRASWVRYLHTERDTHICNWDGIRHQPSGAWLDLSDPFGNGLAPAKPVADHIRRAPETARAASASAIADDEVAR